jgi:phage repressor protein C with HTH and peptisase S24 domain
MFLYDGPIDWVPRPRSLLNVHEPYALYMVGESMMPRFRPGQLLYVNPHRPITPGYGAVVTKKTNAVMVKEFVRRTNQTLLVRQYNPEEPIEIDLDEVVDVHTIVQVDEP